MNSSKLKLFNFFIHFGWTKLNNRMQEIHSQYFIIGPFILLYCMACYSRLFFCLVRRDNCQSLWENEKSQRAALLSVSWFWTGGVSALVVTVLSLCPDSERDEWFVQSWQSERGETWRRWTTGSSLFAAHANSKQAAGGTEDRTINLRWRCPSNKDFSGSIDILWKLSAFFCLNYCLSFGHGLESCRQMSQ